MSDNIAIDHMIKGWCPGALRPMASGDGIVVRIRPFAGRLSRAQADGIASLSAAHGNGFLDITSRGNIQVRGVTEETLGGLIEGLHVMGLIDPTPEIESRRNIIVTPFWHADDETETLCRMLEKYLAKTNTPDLSGKFGFAVDTGPKPVLQAASADIRFERDADGGLILIADGMQSGKPVTAVTAIEEALALAHWFAAQSGDATRMKALIGQGHAPAGHNVARQKGSYVPRPDRTAFGAVVGLAFGQLRAEVLSSLAKHGALRLTPWRLVLVENADALPLINDVITNPADPLLRIVACTGAPHCPQGMGETRSLAQTLAPHLSDQQTLHISGCTKGCAHPRAAALTVTARNDGYALIRDGKAGDAPVNSGLSPAELKDII